MNKVNQYNQVIFALVGTITLVIFLVAGVVFLVEEFSTRDYDENTLIVEDELDSLKKLNIRNQVISLEGIHLFDTATRTYLIPVYHKKLTNGSSRDDKIFGLLDSNISSDHYYYGYGNYNNIILYNFNSNESKVLLGRRVNIDSYSVFKSKKKSLIVITGWDEDTNGDGKLNEKDFKRLYVYDHSTLILKQVENTSFRILDYDYLKEVDKLIFKVTDVRHDVSMDEEPPEFLVSYSPGTNDLIPLIDMSVLDGLQDIIDN